MPKLDNLSTLISALTVSTGQVTPLVGLPIKTKYLIEIREILAWLDANRHSIQSKTSNDLCETDSGGAR